MRHIDQTACQITGVRGFQRRIRQTLTGPVGRVEIFKNVQTFFEVRDDRAFDDLARRLGHQTAHRSQLLHLGGRPTRTGMAHHIDRVDRLITAAVLFLHRGNAFHHFISQTIRALRPRINDLVVFLALRDQTVIELLFIFFRQRHGFSHNRGLVFRHHHVVLTEGNTGAERMTETERHDAVAENHGLFLTAIAVDGINRVGDLFLCHQAIDDIEGNLRMFGQQLRQQSAARCGFINFGHGRAMLVNTRITEADLGVQRHNLGSQRMFQFADIGKGHALPRLIVGNNGEIIKAQHNVLRRHDDRLTIGRMQDVVGRHHQHAGFKLCFERQRHMHGHLVTVEVGIERRTNKRMQLDRLAFDQHRLKGLNAKTM